MTSTLKNASRPGFLRYGDCNSPAMPEESSFPMKSRYVYLSGTGRSGTSVLGRALGCHSKAVYFNEPKFMTCVCGIRYLIEDRCNLDEFSKFMLYKYAAHIKKAMDIQPDTIMDLIHLVLIKSGSNQDFCRKLLAGLRRILKEKYKDKILIEKQPHLDEIGNILAEWFPRSRFIHIFRDPRDVFASVRTKDWGPDNSPEFIQWYKKRITSSLAAHRVIADERLAVISIETLVNEPRSTLKGLFDFLKIEDETREIEKSSKKIKTPEFANLGRWRSDLAPAEARAVTKHCMPLYDRLRQSEEAWLRGSGVPA